MPAPMSTRDDVDRKSRLHLSTRHTFSGSYVWNRDLVDRPDSIGSLNYFYDTVSPIYNDNRRGVPIGVLAMESFRDLARQGPRQYNLAPGTFQRRGDLPDFFVANSRPGAPSLLFTSPFSEKLPESRNVKNYSIQDNANWIKGYHSFSFGFQVSRFPASARIGTTRCRPSRSAPL